MIERILVAVDDSAPAMRAAAFGVALARTLGAELHLVTVAEPGRDPDVILRHLAGTAHDVPPRTWVTDGERPPFEALLSVAAECGADLVVMGRSDRRGGGRPYVGSQTEHLLEFTDIPVVVVPESSEVVP